jgi:poly(3-hydroxybutyrate) depolymerase
MKVAAVALLCQDVRVFKAMEMAGTPCPYMGEIGGKASSSWTANISDRPDSKEYNKQLKKENKVAYDKAKGKAGMQRKVKNGQSYWTDYWRMCKHEKNSNGSSKSRKTCKVEYARVSSS